MLRPGACLGVTYCTEFALNTPVGGLSSMKSYIELITDVEALTQLAEKVSAGLSRDAVGEILSALSDLARLEGRVRKSMSALITKEEVIIEAVLKPLLRENAGSHPQLAALFAEYSDVQISGLCFSAGANTEKLMRDDEPKSLAAGSANR
jgi:hypothetical protein